MERNVQLEVVDLVKRFGADTVLDGISLKVHQGEVVVVLGPSGCGKSTLLRCMNGLERPDGGSILVDGEKVDPDARRSKELRQ